MTATPETPEGAAPALAAMVQEQAAEARARGRGLRLGDRLDAMLVRELQQAVSGRVFPIMLILALLAMLLLVTAVLGDSSGMLTRGSAAFAGVLGALSFVVCGIVPLQAFFATRQEAVGESADALLLTRLSPWAIVRGKLTATNAHMLMWLSLAAPLLALTWMLRGISVPQILLGLLLVSLGSTVISALAVAAGTLARFERLSTLANLLGLVGIFFAASVWTTYCIRSVAFSSMRLDGEEIGAVIGALAPIFAFAILVARSQFTHPFENRSTPFRVLLPAGIILAFIVMAPFVSDDTAYLVVLVCGAMAMGVFVIFAATEEDGLSPWLARRVPKRRLRAAWLAPLLPGGSRGLLWGLGMIVLLVAGIDFTTWRTGHTYALLWGSGSGSWTSTAPRAALLTSAYAMFYGALGRFVRPHMRSGVAGNWIARSFVFCTLVALSIGPMLLQLLLSHKGSWTVLQVFNPFWTIAETTSEPLLDGPAFFIIVLLTALLLLAHVASMRAGVEEVVKAGEARKSREG